MVIYRYSVFPSRLLYMTWPLFPVVCVCVFACMCVFDFGTLVVESRVGLTLIHLLSFRIYQARGDASPGLLGFSGDWVSVRALCKRENPQPPIIHTNTNKTFKKKKKL